MSQGLVFTSGTSSLGTKHLVPRPIIRETERQHVQFIALGSAYAAMKAMFGDKSKTMMKAWMADIEKCVQFS